MFRQVVGTILRLANRYPDQWLTIRGSHDVPAYGFERIIDPPPLEVNTLRLLSEFHAGSLTLAETWRSDARARPPSRPCSSSPSEAGRLGDAARTRLGVGGDVASTTATKAQLAAQPRLEREGALQDDRAPERGRSPLRGRVAPARGVDRNARQRRRHGQARGQQHHAERHADQCRAHQGEAASTTRSHHARRSRHGSTALSGDRPAAGYLPASTRDSTTRSSS